ncbi:MAG: DUF1559 domain-containing protein [Gemmataceae bacterium]
MHKALTIVLFGVLALPAAAADSFDAGARAKAIAPFLDDQTFGIGHLDVTRVDVDKIVASIGALGKIEARDLDKPKKEFSAWVDAFTKAGGKDIFAVVSLRDFPSEPYFVVPLAENSKADALAKLLAPNPGTKFTIIRKALVVGTESVLDRLRDTKPGEQPDLAKAFAAAGDTTAQVLLLPSDDNRKVIEQLLPNLPKEAGGGATKPFTRGIQWAAIGIDGPPKTSAKLIIQAPDAPAAKELKTALADLSKAAPLQNMPGFGEVVKTLTPEIKDDRLLVSLNEKTIKDVFGPLVVKVRQSALRSQSSNNLKQMAIAMHMYHDVYGKFPPAYNVDKDGKPLLSWRVHILPYIEQEALYKEFHLDEPWDSAHNKKLLARMPKIYQSSKSLAEGLTTYLTPRAKETVFPGKDAVSIKDITDGTSNTIMIVDADDAHAVAWTKPEDLPIDSKKPEAGLANRNGKGFLVAMCDGSVRFISNKISAQTLWSAFTRAGGEVLGSDW